jgi:NADH-quinone oxidoreductase subunit G
MTVTANSPVPAAKPDGAPAEGLTVTIDGIEVSVPKGTLVIRAAEMIGIQIPRFCDHPLLDPVGACRQCLVEIEGQRKPLASCTTTVTDGMVVRTQLSSPVADKAQQGIMEFLLINHPLDCPICDKGGECPLQNQAMSNGRSETRFVEVKRTFPKPINISPQVLLDRERCVLCARCTRFSAQIAGDPFIEMLERGALQQVGIYAEEPFESYFSGNTIQICPVGALTSAAYRFRSRPFDLVSSPSVCEHCASGCALRTDHRRGTVMRRLAGEDPAVNEEWNCDKGRFAFTYSRQPDRLVTPLVRGADGHLAPASWAEALSVVAERLAAARGRAGVLVGGRVPLEDAYAYAKFARVALGTNDIDFRARPHSAEEAEFLAAFVAGRGRPEPTPTYADVEQARTVLLVGLEPEEESPILFLRLRKAAVKKGLPIYSIAPFASRGLAKMSGRLLRAVPGSEPDLLDSLADGGIGPAAKPSNRLGDDGLAAARGLRDPKAVILVGERMATVPGALSAVSRLARHTGAALGWVPRRAGERGAVEAGALPNLLPGGHPVADPAARQAVAAAWELEALPEAPGRDTGRILAAAAAGELDALVVGGVDPADLPDPDAALAAIEAAGFVLSLELRASAVTERADVVLPVTQIEERRGTFVDWEGRERPYEQALHDTGLTGLMPDVRVLHSIAAEMGVGLGLPRVSAAYREYTKLGGWAGPRAVGPSVPPAPQPQPRSGEAVLATWHLLLDAGRMQDGEPHLAATAQPAHAQLAPATAAELGIVSSSRSNGIDERANGIDERANGIDERASGISEDRSADDPGPVVTVSTDRGSITLPVVVTDMPERVVWLPTNSPGSAVRSALSAIAGDVVRIAGRPPVVVSTGSTE